MVMIQVKALAERLVWGNWPRSARVSGTMSPHTSPGFASAQGEQRFPDTCITLN